MLAAWKAQQGDEQKFRAIYAGWLLFALFLQLLMANAAFLLLGFGLIHVGRWVAHVFFVGVFGQIAGMAFLILRYLFPERSSDLLELLEKL